MTRIMDPFVKTAWNTGIAELDGKAVEPPILVHLNCPGTRVCSLTVLEATPQQETCLWDAFASNSRQPTRPTMADGTEMDVFFSRTDGLSGQYSVRSTGPVTRKE